MDYYCSDALKPTISIVVAMLARAARRKDWDAKRRSP